jgi:hypothetical protein
MEVQDEQKPYTDSPHGWNKKLQRRISELHGILWTDARLGSADRNLPIAMNSRNQDRTSDVFMLCVKIVVFALPPSLLPQLIPGHKPVVACLSLLLGAVLQSLIPPRKHGLLIIALTAAVALVYSLISRIWPI